jgi:hypothetical protein
MGLQDARMFVGEVAQKWLDELKTIGRPQDR